MNAISPLLAIEQERRFHSQMAWIGVVDEVTKRWLWLHQVRPNATWRKRPLSLDPPMNVDGWRRAEIESAL
jgi:hypothetical protein